MASRSSPTWRLMRTSIGPPRSLPTHTSVPSIPLTRSTVAMAAAKTLTAWAGQVPGSSIVTSMGRNGTTYGVRLSGEDARLFTAARRTAVVRTARKIFDGTVFPRPAGAAHHP